MSHLTQLIDDLMDVSRITRNKLDLRKQRVNLTDALEAAVESSRPLMVERNHELTMHLPEYSIYLHGDLVRLAQVFTNLLTNAAKYTLPGGRITLSAELSTGCATGPVQVRVTDTGVGIAKDNLAHVFEMFYQAEGATARADGGLGIGLALVKRLVEMHGGTVSVSSDGPGCGSEFLVSLPTLKENNAIDASQAAKAVKSFVRRRIVIADDNRDAAMALAMLLSIDHEVETAHDGEEALKKIEHLRPDVGIIDLGMPKLDGYQLCRHIRQQSWGRKMRLIALTGWGQEEDRRQSKDCGFDVHLVKPIDAEAIDRALTTG